MYYDTLQEAIDAAPDCTHVLTTGHEWNRDEELKGKFQPVRKSGESYYDYLGEGNCMRDDCWVVSWARGENLPDEDMVNNPPHYKLWPDMEAYDVIVKTLTRDELIGWHKGNSLKYRLRAGAKGELVEQINKAEWHENKLRGL